VLPYKEVGDEERRHGGHQSENQVLREHLVELEGDDDAEAERELEGRVEQEEGLPLELAPVRGQARAPPPRASAAAPRLRPHCRT